MTKLLNTVLINFNITNLKLQQQYFFYIWETILISPWYKKKERKYFSADDFEFKEKFWEMKHGNLKVIF